MTIKQGSQFFCIFLTRLVINVINKLMNHLQISLIHSTRELSKSNILAVEHLLDSTYSNKATVIKVYKAGTVIVKEGKAIENGVVNLDYVQVPLGLILQGEVIVHKSDKDTKKLEPGDFVGLFETADYLSVGKNRNIGDWTLTAKTDVEILFFSKDLFDINNLVVDNFKKYIIKTAQTDSVPQPTSSMPLLDWLASNVTTHRLHDHAIIVHTHLLPNNVPLFRHLAHLVGANRIFVIGKPYSTIHSAYLQIALAGIEIITINLKSGAPYSFAAKEGMDILWHRVLESRKQNTFSKLIILDDGGDVWTSIPWEKAGDLQIAGTEQTQRGITRILDTRMRLPSIISTATSGIKKEIESVFIGQSVIRKLNQVVDYNTQKIGILGMGSIGKAIFYDLLKRNIQCYYYDPLDKNFGDGKLSSIDELLHKSDVIIGATGQNVLQETPFERVEGHKILVSVSSADLEFGSVLQFQEKLSQDPFADITARVHDNLSFTVLNGGYPINFDRKNDATPDDEIVLTRCLLYIGMMQAEKLLEKGEALSGFYNLDMAAQTNLLKKWFLDVPEKSKQFNLDTELQHINDNNRSDFYNTVSVWVG
jgi:D-isomer specific 2-hydroxyacid dehydrogenase, NAD binding domain